MVTANPVVPISNSISNALERLFKTGGFALAFGFAGLLLALCATVVRGQLILPMFYVGCILIFFCLGYFALSRARTREVTRRVKDDLPLLDGLQGIALQLTDLAAITQSVAFKHLPTIQRGVKTVLPLIERLPIVGPAARNSGLAEAAKLSDAIVGITESAKNTIRELEDAIRSGDLNRLRNYSTNLSEAITSLSSMLKA